MLLILIAVFAVGILISMSLFGVAFARLMSAKAVQRLGRAAGRRDGVSVDRSRSLLGGGSVGVTEAGRKPSQLGRNGSPDREELPNFKDFLLVREYGLTRSRDFSKLKFLPV